MTNINWFICAKPDSDGMSEISIHTLDNDLITLNLSEENAISVSLALTSEIYDFERVEDYECD